MITADAVICSAPVIKPVPKVSANTMQHPLPIHKTATGVRFIPIAIRIIAAAAICIVTMDIIAKTVSVHPSLTITGLSVMA